MIDYVTLIGAEAVEQAGHRISAAAESMSRSAATMEHALIKHSRSLEESVERLEALLEARALEETDL